jgi:hypothetical protein
MVNKSMIVDKTAMKNIIALLLEQRQLKTDLSLVCFVVRK